MEAQETPRCESCASHHSSPALPWWVWGVFGILFGSTIGAGRIATQDGMGLMWIIVVVEGLMTILAGGMLVEVNVIGARAFFFLDEEGKFHTHCEFLDANLWTRSFTVLDVRLAGWFRKSVILGSASLNWKIVDARDGKVRVCDRTAKQYELWTQEPEEVLRLITRFVSMEDILATLDRRERALDELGIGVQKLVLWALANKDRARSQHARDIREQMQELLVNLQWKGHLQKERIAGWLVEANARLAAETEAVRAPTAPTDNAQTKGGSA